MVGLGEARANHSNRNLWKLLGPLKRSPAPAAAPDASPGSGVSFSVTASIDSLRQKLLWSLHNNKQQESNIFKYLRSSDLLYSFPISV